MLIYCLKPYLTSLKIGKDFFSSLKEDIVWLHNLIVEKSPPQILLY